MRATKVARAAQATERARTTCSIFKLWHCIQIVRSVPFGVLFILFGLAPRAQPGAHCLGMAILFAKLAPAQGTVHLRVGCIGAVVTVAVKGDTARRDALGGKTPQHGSCRGRQGADAMPSHKNFEYDSIHGVNMWVFPVKRKDGVFCHGGRDAIPADARFLARLCVAAWCGKPTRPLNMHVRSKAKNSAL